MSDISDQSGHLSDLLDQSGHLLHLLPHLEPPSISGAGVCGKNSGTESYPVWHFPLNYKLLKAFPLPLSCFTSTN